MCDQTTTRDIKMLHETRRTEKSKRDVLHREPVDSRAERFRASLAPALCFCRPLGRGFQDPTPASPTRTAGKSSPSSRLQPHASRSQRLRKTLSVFSQRTRHWAKGTVLSLTFSTEASGLTWEQHWATRTQGRTPGTPGSGQASPGLEGQGARVRSLEFPEPLLPGRCSHWVTLLSWASDADTSCNSPRALARRPSSRSPTPGGHRGGRKPAAAERVAWPCPRRRSAQGSQTHAGYFGVESAKLPNSCLGPRWWS